MTPLQLRDYIVTKIPAEEALLKLLAGVVTQYENLKKNKPIERRTEDREEISDVNPMYIIAAAAMDMGWDFCLENQEDPDNPMRGIIVGTDEFMKKMLKYEKV